jgi:hypothetical protein
LSREEPSKIVFEVEADHLEAGRLFLPLGKLGEVLVDVQVGFGEKGKEWQTGSFYDRLDCGRSMHDHFVVVFSKNVGH